MANVTVKTYSSNATVLVEDESFVFYTDDFIDFSYKENIEDVREELGNKNIPDEIIDSVLDELDIFIRLHSAANK